MKRILKQASWGFLLSLGILVVMAGTALAADPLDEAQQKLASFLTKTSNIALVLLPTAGGLAVTGLAVKRALAKAAGEEEGMVRSNNQILSVLKYTALGSGASLLVAIASSILK